MSVLRGLWEPSLLPGNHIQRSGKMLVSFLCFVCRVLYVTLLLLTLFYLWVVFTLAECASGPGHMYLHSGTVPVGPRSAGDVEHG